MRRSVLAVAVLVLNLSAAYAEDARQPSNENAKADVQEITADVASIKSCLDRARSYAQKNECIGTIVKSCESEPSDVVQAIQTLFCRSREAAAWDQLLNENFKRKIKMIQEGEMPEEAVKARQLATLRAAQRLWIQFRDAELDRAEAELDGAASIWLTAGIEFVRMDMTARRALDLD